MNFTSLRYFCTLAEELNFTKAAKKLYISQQALSSHISKLEQHFGSQLFIRSTPLELTPAGHCLYLFATETLLYEQIVTEKIHNLGSKCTAHLTIGTTLSRGNILMPLILPPFQKLYPDVKVDLIQSSSDFVEQLLIDKKADVIIGYTPAPKNTIISEFLCMDNLSLCFTEECLRQTYPEDWKSRIRQLEKHCHLDIIGRCKFIKMLDSLPLGKSFNDVCKSQQISPSIYLEVRAIETMVAMCLENLGAIICPDMFISIPFQPVNTRAGQKLYKFPIHADTPVPSVSISYLNKRPVEPYIQDLVQIVRSRVQEWL